MVRDTLAMVDLEAAPAFTGGCLEALKEMEEGNRCSGVRRRR